MMMIAVAGLLLIAAPASDAPSYAGLYEVRQMEVAGGLELKLDGKFRYALSYGAVDEEGQGNWTSDGKTVRLTSDPMPKAPSFELLRDDPAPKGQLWMTFDKASFNWTGRVSAIATAQGLEGKGRVSASPSDGRVETGGRILTSVEPLVPVYASPGGVVRLSPQRGHRLLFRFHPNDLGRPIFQGQQLASDGSTLLLDRYDTIIRFLRVRTYKAAGREKRGRK
jgi:hypothetical protein